MIGKSIFQLLRTLDLMSRPQGTTKKESIIETLFNAMILNEACRVIYHVFRDDGIRGMEIDSLHFFKSRGRALRLGQNWRRRSYMI
jgi:hypothetical protein